MFLNSKTSKYTFRFSPARLQSTFISFHDLLLVLVNVLYSLVSVIRYPSLSEMLPLNKWKVAALVVNGETCCYTTTFRKGSGHLLGSELCGATVMSELTPPSPSSPAADLHAYIWGSGERDWTDAKKNPPKCCRTCP